MSIRILTGDCREVLATLPEKSVQCCVTSPPYYGLRDYGTAEWTGGWDPKCDHPKNVWDGPKQTQGAQSGHAAKFDKLGRRECVKCGAVRVDRQIGLEQSPDEYVAEMVAVFRDVRRVLRDDGVLWLNLGDSYSVKHVGRRDHGTGDTTSRLGPNRDGLPGGTAIPSSGNWQVPGMKAKDLLGIPWMVAFALRADGWYLRSAVVWHKPNPMPESVTDRPTSAYEMVFLLSKLGRYFYDADAIAEVSTYGEHHQKYQGTYDRHKIEQMQQSGAPNGAQYQRGLQQPAKSPLSKNARNVWTIVSQPFLGSHFATMPPDLAERCILAGSAKGDTILDPFGGAGTTALVADRLGRNAIIIELNPEYAAMARDRIAVDGGMFSVVDPPPAPKPAVTADLFAVSE